MRYKCLPDNKEEIDQIYFDEAIYKHDNGRRYNKEQCKAALVSLLKYKNDFSAMNCLLCDISATKCAARMRCDNGAFPVEYVQHSEFDCHLNQEHISLQENLITVFHPTPEVQLSIFKYKPPFCHCQNIGILRVPV